MGIHLAEQTAAFLYSLLVGAGLGLVYDVFRVTRVAVRTGKAVIFIEDIVFFCIAAAITFLFLMGASDGKVRIFLLIGEFIGATLYYFTIGQLVMKASTFITNMIKAFFRFIFSYLLLPIWRAVYFIISFILRPVRFLGKKLKKSLQRLKIHLKTKRILLYNYLIALLHKKLRKRNDDSEREEARRYVEK